MDAIVEQLLEQIRRESRLVVNVRIFENETRHAPLGLLLHPLGRIFFCGAVAEFIYSYVLVLEGQPSPYKKEVFAHFREQLDAALQSETMKPASQSWVGLCDDKEAVQRCYDLFTEHLAERDGGLPAAASGDILRLELVDLHKENPTVGQIIARGAVTAVIMLGGIFGATHLIEEYNAPKCMEIHAQYGIEQAKILAEGGKFYGKPLDQEMNNIQTSTEAAMAACRGSLSSFKTHIGTDGVTVVVHSPNT